MTQDPPDPGTQHDDPLAGPTYLIGLVGVILLVAIVILVQTLVYDSRDELQAEVRTRDYLEVGALRRQQTEQLESYRWTFPEENRVGIPISSGVERVLERYGAR